LGDQHVVHNALHPSRLMLPMTVNIAEFRRLPDDATAHLSRRHPCPVDKLGGERDTARFGPTATCGSTGDPPAPGYPADKRAP
jgi:hypothetical protein